MSITQSFRWTRSDRTGLSLLEVLLSIAILGGALVVIGNLITHGYRAATETKLRTQANLLCKTKMAEVVAGIIELESVAGQTIPEAPDWEYSIEIEPSDQLGLLFVKVTVVQSKSVAAVPLEISFVRFVPDPDYDPTADDDPNA